MKAVKLLLYTWNLIYIKCTRILFGLKKRHEAHCPYFSKEHFENWSLIIYHMVNLLNAHFCQFHVKNTLIFNYQIHNKNINNYFQFENFKTWHANWSQRWVITSFFSHILNCVELRLVKNVNWKFNLKFFVIIFAYEFNGISYV